VGRAIHLHEGRWITQPLILCPRDFDAPTSYASWLSASLHLAMSSQSPHFKRSLA